MNKIEAIGEWFKNIFGFLPIVFYQIFWMSLIASCVGVVIWSLRRLTKRQVPVVIGKYLWVLFLFLLIIPVHLESKWSIYNYIPDLTKQEFEIGEQNSKDSSMEMLPEASINKEGDVISEKKDGATKTLNWGRYVSYLWGIGVLGFGFLFYHSRRKFVHGYTTSQVVPKEVEEVFSFWKNRLGIKKWIELVMQESIGVPAIYGIFHTKLILPSEVAKMTKEEIEYIMIHELSHYKKGDLILNELLNFLRIFYWFQPVVLWQMEEIKRDLEYETDYLTIQRKEEKEYKNYCKTLLKLAGNRCLQNRWVMAISKDGKELERRIKMLKLKNTSGKSAILIMIVMLIGISLLSVSLATNKVTQDIENRENIIGEEVEKESVKMTDKKLILPVEGKVSAIYGTRVHPIIGETISHNGIDIVAEKGTEVVVVDDGVVLDTGFDATYGNYVKVQHSRQDEVSCSFYAHLSKVSVEKDAQVEQGTKIGEVGNTGKSTGAHLHFEISNVEGNTQNPEDYIHF